MHAARLPIGLIPLAAVACMSAVSAEAAPGCSPMELPILRVEGRPSQYEDFCGRYPEACVLDGAAVIEWTEEVLRILNEINARVNDEVMLVSDMDNLGLEENWSFPRDCRGDCEDFALEKRERIVDASFPRASLTIAFAFHEVQFFPHAVLLVETTNGTWVLDNLDDEVRCWDTVPYRFTRRERPDGNWIRFASR